MTNTEPLIIFNHIHKTGGSYFRKAVIEANVPLEQIYRFDGNYAKFITEINSDKYKVVAGHIPYGLHSFTVRPVRYITFLREPIDRAISQYYFLRSSNALLYGKPMFYDYANSVSLGEFYQDIRFHNWQTRFVAGFLSHKFSFNIRTALSDKIILRKATYNLKNRYFCILIKENYQNSLQTLQQKLGWNNLKKEVKKKNLRVTNNKPEIKDIDSQTMAIIKEANKLDLELYDLIRCKTIQSIQ